MKQSKEGLKTDIVHILSERLQYHHLLFWEVTEGELNDIPVSLNIEEYTLMDYLLICKAQTVICNNNSRRRDSILYLQRI